jgi:hypothetical protein
MKKISLLLLFIAIYSYTQAQIPPHAFNYSAVARNAAGQPIATATIGIQISIVKTSTSGTTVYTENHFVNTDAYGLFNLVIGGGAIQSGNMASINWSNDNYYLKVGMDANGGTNFLTMGTTQLLSVPYALHSATADSLIGGSSDFSGDYNDLINKPITVSSISQNGDTLHLSNGQTFIAGSNGTSSLVLPSITTNAVTEITSNTATLGGIISNANGNQIMERGIVYSTSPNPTINSTKLAIGNGIGAFNTYDTISNYPFFITFQANTTYYVRAYAITENNISAYGNEVSYTTLPIGQIGPGGGIVFFDKGNNIGGWQYLEAAPSDQSTGINWGCYQTSIPGTQSIIGSGETNTALIVASCNDVNFAAKLCDDLVLGGQSDWFLPSRIELYLMLYNLDLNPNSLDIISYWSSTELNADIAYTNSYHGNSGGNVMGKANIYGNTLVRVRAVRAF